MKTDFVDVSDTQKTLTVEIPSDLVDAEIDRIAKGYARQARLPGFRPGKAPRRLLEARRRRQVARRQVTDLQPGERLSQAVPPWTSRRAIDAT